MGREALDVIALCVIVGALALMLAGGEFVRFGGRIKRTEHPRAYWAIVVAFAGAFVLLVVVLFKS